jgi:hypothetical protein
VNCGMAMSESTRSHEPCSSACVIAPGSCDALPRRLVSSVPEGLQEQLRVVFRVLYDQDSKRCWHLRFPPLHGTRVLHQLVPVNVAQCHVTKIVSSDTLISRCCHHEGEVLRERLRARTARSRRSLYRSVLAGRSNTDFGARSGIGHG